MNDKARQHPGSALGGIWGGAFRRRRNFLRPGRVMMALGCILLNALSAGALEWHSEAGYRWAALEKPPPHAAGFKVLSPETTGLRFTNTLGEVAGEVNRVLQNGSGLCVGDFDNDGRPDVFLCSLEGPSRLFRNLGNWRFEDVTERVGLGFTNRLCRGSVFADINGDGFLDLLVAVSGQGVLCFRNEGGKRFVNVTDEAGTASRFGSVGMALADVDGNGSLDLYVVNNRTDDIRDRGQVDIQRVGGKLTIPPWFKDRLLIMNGQLFEYGEPDQLYLNDGHGRFKAVPWTEGAFVDENGRPLVGPPLDWGLTAAFHDLNHDGRPDLYVCNDYWTPDRIWINDGGGKFHALSSLAIRDTSASSMGVDVADINRDDWPDIFIVDMLSRDPKLRKRQMLAQQPVGNPVGMIGNRMQTMRNTLLLNRQDGTFAEMANFAGLAASEWSWQPFFIDVDLDGYEDLLVVAGHFKDVQDIDAGIQIKAQQERLRRSPRLKSDGSRMTPHEAFIDEKIQNARLYPGLKCPVIAFHNLGSLRFEETTRQWGLEKAGVHHSIAAADFDGDGDLDFVVNSLGEPALVLSNEGSESRVAVRLKGRSPNTQAIGSVVRLRGEKIPAQSREVISGGRYMTGSDSLISFAARNTPMTLEVSWPSGAITTIAKVEEFRLYEIDEPEAGGTTRAEKQKAIEPYFEDLSSALEHTHYEEAFDDFERQPLLPFKLSQAGPGLAWIDLDGDGRDELIIGAGRGGSLGAFRWVDTKFSPVPVRARGAPDDYTGIAGWRRGPGEAVVLAGLANYEVSNRTSLWSFVAGQAGLVQTNALEAADINPGAISVADLDGDGNLDLFLGGRARPGRYPEATRSLIYRSVGGNWQLDEENSRRVQNVGIVNGSVWSDLDGDGFPELILACEWGPIRVFKNNRGKLSEATAEMGLTAYTGLWTGVTTGDLDGDGKMEIIASNWGLNSPYHADSDRALKIFFGENRARGSVDLVETEYEPGTGRLLPRRGLAALSASLPFLIERFATHRAFSEASLDDVLGNHRVEFHELSVTTLASTVLYLQGKGVRAVPLPVEAQFSRAFGVSVADFDGDGYEDIFLSQNFFALQPELTRLDAGLGLWIRGGRAGALEAVPAALSGVRVYGEQRGSALSDFDGDGRVDLAVSQNGAETKVFRNVRGKPGLRVRLEGRAGNPSGIGAVIRLQFGQKLGPAREIHAGSGYWSQDSLVAVLATPTGPDAVVIRWPGGSSTTNTVPKGAREVVVREEGGGGQIVPGPPGK